MVMVLTFSLTLLLAVLLSELAHRSVLSTTILFLAAGVLIGQILGLVRIEPRDPIVLQFANLALFSVLFTDGMRVGIRDLASAWRLPGRALLVGLPMTFGATALLGRVLAGMPWKQSLLIGAALAPTDPVFAAAIVGREEVPQRIRHLLNVESGLNDGLALPIVVVFLGLLGRPGGGIGRVLAEAGAGIALGVAIPAAAVLLARAPFLAAAAAYAPFYGLAIGLALLATADLTGANLFLAAFIGGITVASLGPQVRDDFHLLGDLVAELFKLAAVLVFGAVVTSGLLKPAGVSGYVFAAFALFLVRPVVLWLSLLGSSLNRWERLVVGWFGPKGFASVVFALLIVQAQIPLGRRVFSLLALVIIGSIVTHSSTDTLVARSFRDLEARPPRDDPDRPEGTPLE